MQIEIRSTMKTDRLGNRLWINLDWYVFVLDGVVHGVPPGFVFDGNSNIRGLWGLCAPVGGAYGDSGLIHDWFYSLDCDKIIPRKQADLIHKEVGIHRGVGKVRAWGVYNALRVLGAGSYRKINSVEKITPATVYDVTYAMEIYNKLTQ